MSGKSRAALSADAAVDRLCRLAAVLATDHRNNYPELVMADLDSLQRQMAIVGLTQGILHAELYDIVQDLPGG